MSFRLKMTGTSSTDDAKVKVHVFQKFTFFLQYEIFHRDAIHLFFVCMKLFLTVVIKDKHTSNDSLQSDPSFLLRDSIMTNTTILPAKSDSDVMFCLQSYQEL